MKEIEKSSLRHGLGLVQSSSWVRERRYLLVSVLAVDLVHNLFDSDGWFVENFSRVAEQEKGDGLGVRVLDYDKLEVRADLALVGAALRFTIVNVLSVAPCTPASC
jgi:hypothetical protein